MPLALLRFRPGRRQAREGLYAGEALDRLDRIVTTNCGKQLRDVVADVAAFRGEYFHLTDRRSAALPDPAGEFGWQVGHAKALTGRAGQRAENLERRLQVDGCAERLGSFSLSD